MITDPATRGTETGWNPLADSEPGVNAGANMDVQRKEGT
eukprot:CAMPEP_0194762782 /NCGR_PEP_ID=MMETSP0323_2-20130528/16928_1 /TAXON_ID=2866 ORGANISM="Crypthecodinium cohnii, Strain Seligo" /NCGR_SAMPLE_ID=MMETSP0323_2 /ASSEMBLY_ACC=CAM_ASM_000346 /LENGTH=38 /DNA_ID= /DNA_START= /DNA_END= /DNA_ORIENTATION=